MYRPFSFGLPFYIQHILLLTLELHSVDTSQQSNARQTRNSDFYSRTSSALDAKRNPHQKPVADVEVAENLYAAEAAAKKVVDSKAKEDPVVLGDDETLPGLDASQNVVAEEEKSVAGRKKMKVPYETEKSQATAEPEKTEKQKDVELELNSILKRSPSEFTSFAQGECVTVS